MLGFRYFVRIMASLAVLCSHAECPFGAGNQFEMPQSKATFGTLQLANWEKSIVICPSKDFQGLQVLKSLENRQVANPGSPSSYLQKHRDSWQAEDAKVSVPLSLPYASILKRTRRLGLLDSAAGSPDFSENVGEFTGSRNTKSVPIVRRHAELMNEPSIKLFQWKIFVRIFVP